MTIAQALKQAQIRLESWPNASLDAETLLADLLHKDRSWLLAHGEQTLNASYLSAFEKRVERRAKREPLAYIVGHQPFYGRDFMVTSDVLVPRPESETIVDALKADFSEKAPKTIIDVGTGSGCLAISAALLFPASRVFGLDISEPALSVARKNGERLQATNTTWEKSDLLDFAIKNNLKADAILANLPYLPQEEIDESPTKDELAYEPQNALLADDQGLALIKTAALQAKNVLNLDGRIYFEMLPWQIGVFERWLAQSGIGWPSHRLCDLSGQPRIVVLVATK